MLYGALTTFMYMQHHSLLSNRNYHWRWDTALRYYIGLNCEKLAREALGQSLKIIASFSYVEGINLGRTVD